MEAQAHIKIALFIVIGFFSQAPTPAQATMVTLFEDDGTGANPWTVSGGSASDLMRNVAAGDVLTLFPVFQGTDAETNFNNSGIDPSAAGILIKAGGFSASGTAGVDSPLMLSTNFSSALLPTTGFSFKITVDTPLFPNLALWIDSVKAEFDQDAAANEDNFWITWGTSVEWVDYVVQANVPGRNPDWRQKLEARINNAQNEETRQRLIKQAEAYDLNVTRVTNSVLVEEWLHFRVDPQDLDGGRVDIELELVDISEPPAPLLVGLALLAVGWSRRGSKSV